MSSWIFGSNVPGKKYSLRFYFGRQKDFKAELKKAADLT